MENLTIKNSDFESNTINLNTENEKNPIIKFYENGDIFVKGKLVENDLEVVEGMREFLKQSNVIKSVCDVCDSTTDKPTYKLCDKHYAEYEKFKQTVL